MATENQKQVAKKIAEKVRNGSKISLSNEMKGIYSDSYATHPERLKRSKGWQELMEEYIPDSLLAKKHLELLNKKEMKRHFQPELGEWVEIETNQIDTQAVKAGLDMGYKLKDKYAAEKHFNVHYNVTPIYGGQSTKTLPENQSERQDTETD